ncbi:MAG: protein kinase [Acidobacteriota bacterium]
MEVPYRILLVDDNEVQQELWVPVLEHEGYSVLSARNGEEALRLIDSELIDLVLLDVMMPGLSGFDVLAELRKNHPADRLAVIMATFNDRDEDIVKAFRLGANDYVAQPLNREVTLARIQAQLRHRQPAAARSGGGAGSQEEAGPAAVGLGSVLDGRYRIDEKLGRGNFGTVYKGLHLPLQMPVAIKVLRAQFGVDQVSLTRFQQEGISLSRLKHPNAVTVHDYNVTEDDVTYLVMELLEGHSLDREFRRGEAISVERCIEVALPVCDVLREAHSLGIIHRDIKPQNIFLHRHRGGETVKVLDFGIAKLVSDADLRQQLTIEGNSVGTPAYMSPERFTNEPYDGRADVYSLAVTLYEMLAGQPLFAEVDGNFFKLIRMHVVEPPRPLREFNPDVPAEVETAILGALAKSKEDRPTARELAEQLAAAIGVEPPRFRKPATEVELGDAVPAHEPTVEIGDDPSE